VTTGAAPTDATITYAIPFYRDAAFLARAVASVVNQTRDDWRLIVVDDAGPDGAAASEVVEALRDPRARYVRADHNAGLAGNWNRCLDLVRTDFVTLLHADDELLPGYTAAVIDGHHRHPDAAAVFCPVDVIDAGGRPTFSAPDAFKRVLAPRRAVDHVVAGDRGLARLMVGNTIFCPTLCLRTAAVGTRRFDPAWRFVLDLAFVTDLLFDGARLVGIPDVAYRYRRHRGSQTAQLTATSERFAEEVAFHTAVARRAAVVGWTRTTRAARLMPSVRLHTALRTVESVARRNRPAAGAGRIEGRHDGHEETRDG
jgi:glycosyltransferase involved in cell wall biosynthesis